MAIEFGRTVTTEGQSFKQAGNSVTTSTNHIDQVASTLISSGTQANYGATQRYSQAVSEGISDTAQAATNAVVLGLDTAWLYLGVKKPASTSGHEGVLDKGSPTVLEKLAKQGVGREKQASTYEQDSPTTLEKLAKQGVGQEKQASTYEQGNGKTVEANNVDKVARTNVFGVEANRFDYSYLFSLQLGNYFMPLSQTFTLRAKKKLNICSLVDGIDIIQQTRKEAKTIDCSLRLTLRENQPNLEIVAAGQPLRTSVYSDPRLTPTSAKSVSSFNATPTSGSTGSSTELVQSLQTLGRFLGELYEADAVLQVRNKTINEVFGVDYAIISEYAFQPQAGRGTFTLNFSLTEVKITNDTLTEDKTQIR